MVGTYKYCLLPRYWLEITILSLEIFSESQLYLRKEQTLKRKEPGEQQRAICGPHQTSAGFVLNLENCVHSRDNTGSVFQGAMLGLGGLGSQQ